MTAPPVTVVVVDWNGFHDTKSCLESLRRLDYSDVSVVLVDNGSTEPIGEMPEVELIRSDHNRGFAGGANIGIRRALEGDAVYVWLLNNDTEVEPGTLSALVATAEADPRVGIVGGVLPDAWGGGRIDAWTGVTKPATGPGDRLDYITGACMLVRRAVFEEVGLFDEAYFFYFEDADLCRRAGAAGWRLAVAPEARVTHRIGASVNRGGAARADRLQAQSSGRFIGKHAGASKWLGVPIRLAGIALNRSRRRDLRAVPQLTRALLHGVRAGSSARQDSTHHGS
jgi:GT2 family glycosyltransferase